MVFCYYVMTECECTPQIGHWLHRYYICDDWMVFCYYVMTECECSPQIGHWLHGYYICDDWRHWMWIPASNRSLTAWILYLWWLNGFCYYAMTECDCAQIGCWLHRYYICDDWMVFLLLCDCIDIIFVMTEWFLLLCDDWMWLSSNRLLAA